MVKEMKLIVSVDNPNVQDWTIPLKALKRPIIKQATELGLIDPFVLTREIERIKHYIDMATEEIYRVDAYISVMQAQNIVRAKNLLHDLVCTKANYQKDLYKLEGILEREKTDILKVYSTSDTEVNLNEMFYLNHRVNGRHHVRINPKQKNSLFYDLLCTSCRKDMLDYLHNYSCINLGSTLTKASFTKNLATYLYGNSDLFESLIPQEYLEPLNNLLESNIPKWILGISRNEGIHQIFKDIMDKSPYYKLAYFLLTESVLKQAAIIQFLQERYDLEYVFGQSDIYYNSLASIDFDNISVTLSY